MSTCGLYLDQEKTKPKRPEPNMELGREGIKKTEHSLYVSLLCAELQMHDLKPVKGCNTQTCRHYVCPNHRKAPQSKKKVVDLDGANEEDIAQSPTHTGLFYCATFN